MYQHGRGVPRDYNEALRWYLLAADKGNVTALSALGTIYRDGEVGQKDLALALKYFKMAAEKGNVSAQINLGTNSPLPYPSLPPLLSFFLSPLPRSCPYRYPFLSL